MGCFWSGVRTLQDTADICVTSLKVSSSLVKHVLGCEVSVISVLPGLCQLRGCWEPLAETERWPGNRGLTTDVGKVRSEASRLKSERVHQDLFDLNDLWLLYHFILFLQIYFFIYRVISH